VIVAVIAPDVAEASMDVTVEAKPEILNPAVPETTIVFRADRPEAEVSVKVPVAVPVNVSAVTAPALILLNVDVPLLLIFKLVITESVIVFGKAVAPLLAPLV
jgi:hypothetical protein